MFSESTSKTSIGILKSTSSPNSTSKIETKTGASLTGWMMITALAQTSYSPSLIHKVNRPSPLKSGSKDNNSKD